MARDVTRIEAARAPIGPDAVLMVDANEAFDFNEALRRGLAYQELRFRWFEEPVRADDIAAHARLAQRLDIPWPPSGRSIRRRSSAWR